MNEYLTQAIFLELLLCRVDIRKTVFDEDLVQKKRRIGSTLAKPVARFLGKGDA